jgi:hypothetical protein
VELGAALQQEIDNRAETVTGQTVVPNIFIIELGSVDYDRLTPYFETLCAELTALADQYSNEQRYTTVDSSHITFDLDSVLETGVFRIRSASATKPHDTPEAVYLNPDITPQVPMSKWRRIQNHKICFKCWAR